MTYRQLITYLILALAMCSAQVAQGQLIVSVEQRQSTSAVPQIVADGLAEGVLVFTDRTHQYREIPEFLLGAEYIMLGNNDKTNASYELDVTLARPATLYLFLDNRIGDDNVDNPPTVGTVMPWVVNLGFESTFEQIGIDEHAVGAPDGWSTVYRLDVPAGTITLLEQNNGGSRRMYGIAAWAARIAAGDPTPEDGAVDLPIDSVLSWAPGAEAATHDVYLGTVFDDVNDASRANPLGVLV
ncbi:MAG: hypothetical protein JW741_09040, partial [Sedimentisphaerales bacterium]|nr:hypothetical protein [Sedimentisphaerales bacterium]